MIQPPDRIEGRRVRIRRPTRSDSYAVYLAAAGPEVMRRGCRNAWLDTHEFQAPRFYQKLGYVVFGKLPDYPPGFTRVFLTKRLGSP
jgi:hypothetical protein